MKLTDKKIKDIEEMLNKDGLEIIFLDTPAHLDKTAFFKWKENGVAYELMISEEYGVQLTRRFWDGVIEPPAAWPIPLKLLEQISKILGGDKWIITVI